MTKAQHTPTLEYHRGEDYAVIMRPEDTTDDACITLRFDTDEECDKWGNLIAAGPELLEAAEAIASGFPYTGHITSKMADDLLAAIAKAKGE